MYILKKYLHSMNVFFFRNIISQLYRTVCITEYNYKSSHLPDKSNESGIIIIIIRLDDKNSDTGGGNKNHSMADILLPNYLLPIIKPEVNKTV